MKRRKGLGSITPLPDGRYLARFTMPDGERATVDTFPTWEDADVRLRLMAEEIEFSENSPHTLSVYGDKVLTERERAGKIRDTESDRGRWNKHILPDKLARMDVRRIRRTHLLEFWKRLEKKEELAHHTRLNVMNVLRVILRAAMDQGVIKETPAKDFKFEAPPSTEDPWMYLTPKQQWHLIRHTRGDERWLVAFAIASGLRAGELVSLRLSDLFLDDDDPHVVIRYGGPPDAKHPKGVPTKTGKIRKVPLVGMALRALTRWLDALPGYCPDNPYDLVFPRRLGGFRDPAHVIRYETWRHAKTNTRGCASLRWHDLRHTAGTSLICGWWGHKWSRGEVQRFLGHAEASTTDRYAHVADSALRDAAALTGYGKNTVMTPRRSQPKSPVNSWAPPGRVELPANGLGKRRTTQQSRALGAHITESYRTLSERARKVLEAVDSGNPLAVAMAVRLAADVAALAPVIDVEVEGVAS